MRNDDCAAEAYPFSLGDPEAAIRRALDMLDRASEDWRGNGDGPYTAPRALCTSGELA